MKILRERDGMLVQVTADGRLLKESFDQHNADGLLNAYRFLMALKDTPYVPKVLGLEVPKNNPVHVHLRTEFIEATPIDDPMLAFRNAVQMLNVFRKRNIVHGDLTEPNIIWRKNMPVVIDWDQSNFAVSEVRPQKRPKPDIVHLMPVLIEKVGDPSRVIRRWQGLRDAISYFFGWGRFVDMGTHMGDFCGLAAAEGMKALGIDSEKIRTCIKPARILWPAANFRKMDIVEYLGVSEPVEVIMMFSTWPYIIENYDRNTANYCLQKSIELSEVFLFEVQLFGDGPGPEFLKTKNDVVQLLLKNGANTVEEIMTIPVGGRPAQRTVWKIT